LTAEEREREENIVMRDISKRNVQQVDLEITQDKIDLMMEHNAKFLLREKEKNPTDTRKKVLHLGWAIPYNEKCDDVYIWIQKMMRDWNHDIQTKPRGYTETNEGRKSAELYRESKRYLMNL